MTPALSMQMLTCGTPCYAEYTRRCKNKTGKNCHYEQARKETVELALHDDRRGWGVLVKGANNGKDMGLTVDVLLDRLVRQN